MILRVNEASFEEDVMKSEIPVLLQFHAPWCGPCRAMAPMLAILSEEFNSGLKVAQVDVDDNPGLVSRFRVAAYPSMILIKKGRILDQMAGFGTLDELMGFLKRNA